MVGTAPLVQARASRYVNRVGWEQARYHKGQGILPSTWQSREAPPHMCPLPVCASVCVRACKECMQTEGVRTGEEEVNNRNRVFAACVSVLCSSVTPNPGSSSYAVQGRSSSWPGLCGLSAV